MFTIRTSPVEVGTVPYAWGIASVYQCTWFCYYRALECGFTAPVWWDRETKQGSYPNAKDWLDNFRDPWEVKDPSYKPVAGDILVYTDSSYGHVIYCESNVMTSEYRSGDPNSFRNAKIGDYRGELIGVLHYPHESVLPVTRNENVPQIETTDESLRIRTEPSLNGEIVGHVQLGYYNVLAEQEATANDKAQVVGLNCWYEISKDRWCANITTKYLPKSDSDFVDEIRKWADNMVATIKEKDKKIADLTADMSKIEEISSRWKTQ